MAKRRIYISNSMLKRFVAPLLFIALLVWSYLCLPVFGEIWLDEFVSLSLINSDNLFSDSIRFQAQSPFYFYILKYFTQAFGSFCEPFIAGRFLSLLFIVIFYRYLRLIEINLELPPYRLLITSLVFYRWLINGSYVRPYGLLLALLAASTYYLLRSFRSMRRRDFCIYGALMTGVFYTHYTGALILVCHFALIYLHFKGRFAEAARYVKSYSLTLGSLGLLFIPGYAHILLWRSRVSGSFSFPVKPALLFHAFELLLVCLATAVSYAEWRRIKILWPLALGFYVVVGGLYLLYLTAGVNFTADRYLLGIGFALLIFVVQATRDLKHYPWAVVLLAMIVFAPPRFAKLSTILPPHIATKFQSKDSLSLSEGWPRLREFIADNYTKDFTHIVYVTPFIEGQNDKFLQDGANRLFLASPFDVLMPGQDEQISLINYAQSIDLQKQIKAHEATKFDVLKPYLLVSDGKIELDNAHRFGMIKGVIVQ